MTYLRLQASTGRGRSSGLAAKLLVVFLLLILYLSLANLFWFLNIASLPLGNLPGNTTFLLVLAAIIVVTLFNSRQRSRRVSSPRSA